METVTRNTSRKRKSKPVVDVPKNQGSDDQIKAFMQLNKNNIAKYMKASFETITKKDVIEVLRECAECAVLTRSPKQGGCWEDDTEIIEEALKVCQPLEESEEEAVEEDVVEESDEEPDAEEVEESKPEKPVAQVASPRKKKTKPATKKAAKKARIKTATKTKTAKVSTKKTKAAKPTKKAQPKTAKTKDSTLPAILTMNRFSAEDVKGLKGLDLWFGTARLLKLQGKIWCQVQDMPEVIGHLFDVHRGKAKLNEEGFKGRGEKSYKKRRLVRMLEAIKAELKL